MRDGRDVASFICACIAVAGLAVALASAQTPLTTKLAPEVREYVKLDDAVIALSHIRVIDGTGRLCSTKERLRDSTGSSALAAQGE